MGLWGGQAGAVGGRELARRKQPGKCVAALGGLRRAWLQALCAAAALRSTIAWVGACCMALQGGNKLKGGCAMIAGTNVQSSRQTVGALCGMAALNALVIK